MLFRKLAVTPPRHRATIVLIVGLVILACVAAIASWTARRSAQASEWVDHTVMTIRQADGAERDLALALANHRTYLIENDTVTLVAYRMAESSLTADLARLQQLTDDNPAQQRRVRELGARLDSLAAFRERVIAARGRDLQGAVALLRTPEAIRARESAVALVGEISAEEHRLLIEREALGRQATRMLNLTLVAALVAAALFGLWGQRLLRQEARAITASEARYRALADDSPDGVLIHAGGRIVYANAAAAAMLGDIVPAQLIGCTFLDIIHPDDRAAVVRRTLQVMNEGERTPVRVVGVLRADGSVGHVETRGAPTEFDGRRAEHLVVRDVSDRRRAERALQLSEERFRAVIEEMDEGVVMYDPSLTAQLWNRAAERILCLTGDQLAGRVPMDPRWRAVDADGNTLTEEQRFSTIAFRTGRPVSGLFGVDPPGGAPVWIRIGATPLFRPGESTPYAVAVTLSDVTELRESARRLAESEARYRLLAEHSGDPVSRRDLEGRFLYASPSHTSVLGWEPEELLGRSGLEFIHPDDLERTRRGSMATSLAGGLPHPTSSGCVTRPATTSGWRRSSGRSRRRMAA